MIIHLVTDRRRLSGRPDVTDVRRCLVRQVRCAVEAGIDVVQLREADLDARVLGSIAGDLLDETRGTPTRLVVNERLDVALAVGADGVHLPGRALPPASARRLAPPGFLIGRSVHGVDDVRSSDGADYLVAGTVWPSASKPAGGVLLGLAGLQAIARATLLPVIAIGGVTDQRAADVRSAGAAGIAAIGLFVGDPDASACGAIPLGPLVRSLRQRFDTSGSPS